MAILRKLFPGNNTATGFFSFYDHILPQDTANYFYVIKGGPGVGKSTFMRKIGMDFYDRGYDIEFMCCSSDNNSLDGVVIPHIKTAFIDGTAPHIVDPKFPGGVATIIHLGDYWNEEVLRQHRPQIIELTKEISEYFKSAYRYLKAAHCFLEDAEAKINQGLKISKLNLLSKKLIKELFGKTAPNKRPGKSRHLFATAITPDGPINYLDTVFIDTKILYLFEGPIGSGKSLVISQLVNWAILLNLDIEVYHCAFEPNKIDGFYLPEFKIGVMKSTSFINLDVTRLKNAVEIKIIDFEEFTGNYPKQRYQHSLEQFFSLFELGCAAIKQAKLVHDELEKFYIPSMDFGAIEARRLDVLNKLLAKL